MESTIRNLQNVTFVRKSQQLLLEYAAENERTNALVFQQVNENAAQLAVLARQIHLSATLARQIHLSATHDGTVRSHSSSPSKYMET